MHCRQCRIRIQRISLLAIMAMIPSSPRLLPKSEPRNPRIPWLHALASSPIATSSKVLRILKRTLLQHLHGTGTCISCCMSQTLHDETHDKGAIHVCRNYVQGAWCHLQACTCNWHVVRRTWCERSCCEKRHTSKMFSSVVNKVCFN